MTQRLATEWLVLVVCFVICAAYAYVAPQVPTDMFGSSIVLFPVVVAPFLYGVVGALRLTVAAARMLTATHPSGDRNAR